MVAEPANDFLNPAYRKADAGSYHVYAFVSDAEFVLAVIDSKRRLMALRRKQNVRNLSTLDFLDECALQEDLLKVHYGKAQLVVQASQWLVAPEEVNKLVEPARHLETCFTLTPTDRVITDIVSPLKAVVNYALPVEFEKKTLYYLKEHTTRHSLTELMLLCIKLHPLLKKTLTLAVAFFPSRVALVLLQDKKLLLVNQYETRTADDVMYYTAAALQATGVPLTDLTAYAVGHSSYRNDAEKMLKELVPGWTSVNTLFPAVPDSQAAQLNCCQLAGVVPAEFML